MWINIVTWCIADHHLHIHGSHVKASSESLAPVGLWRIDPNLISLEFMLNIVQRCCRSNFQAIRGSKHSLLQVVWLPLIFLNYPKDLSESGYPPPATPAGPIGFEHLRPLMC